VSLEIVAIETMASLETLPVSICIFHAAGSGSDINIQGTGFGNILADVSVRVGNVNCTVLSVADDAITCNLGQREGGAVSTHVSLATKSFFLDLLLFPHFRIYLMNNFASFLPRNTLKPSHALSPERLHGGLFVPRFFCTKKSC